MVLAEGANPGRAFGEVLFRVVVLGLIVWGIVHLIRKRRRPGPTAQHPQPYWDGATWRYPPQPQGPQAHPQPYWDGVAWRYPPQQPQQPPYPQQAYQQPPYEQQPPYPGAGY